MPCNLPGSSKMIHLVVYRQRQVAAPLRLDREVANFRWISLEIEELPTAA